MIDNLVLANVAGGAVYGFKHAEAEKALIAVAAFRLAEELLRSRLPALFPGDASRSIVVDLGAAFVGWWIASRLVT